VAKKTSRRLGFIVDGFPVRKRSGRRLDFVVDKLTNSIENAVTGEIFATRLIRLHPKDASLLAKTKWQFNWAVELRTQGHEVYALATLENPEVIQGLISISDEQDHVFIPLIESAPFNIAGKKQYAGVPGNLVALHAIAP
jgi:hypothetical protein